RSSAIVVVQLRRNERKHQAVIQRSAVPFARALVRSEKEQPVSQDWTTQRSAKLMAVHHGPWPACGVEKEIVRVERTISQEVVSVTVKVVAARLRHCFDIPAGVPSLRCIVQTRLHDELLNRVSCGNGDVRR